MNESSPARPNPSTEAGSRASRSGHDPGDGPRDRVQRTPPAPGSAQDGSDAGRITLVGVALSLGSVLFLAGLRDMRVRDALVLTGILVLVPALGVAQARAVNRLAAVERMSAYGSSAIGILVLGGLAIGAGLSAGGPERLSLAYVPVETLALATVVVLGSAAIVIAVAELVRRSLGIRESRLLAALFPRTPGERRAFAGLSLVAGLGEEAAYRGYAIPMLAAAVAGPWYAAVATSIAFGAVHAYQGVFGVLRTATLGMLLAVPVVLLGCVWPSVVAHVVIDLVGGLWLGPRMMAESGRTAAGRHTDPWRPSEAD